MWRRVEKARNFHQVQRNDRISRIFADHCGRISVLYTPSLRHPLPTPTGPAGLLSEGRKPKNFGLLCRPSARSALKRSADFVHGRSSLSRRKPVQNSLKLRSTLQYPGQGPIVNIHIHVYIYIYVEVCSLARGSLRSSTSPWYILLHRNIPVFTDSSSIDKLARPQLGVQR